MARGRRQARLPQKQPQEGPPERRPVDRGEGTRRGRAILQMRVSPETGGRAIKVSVRKECFLGEIAEVEWGQRKPYDEFDFGYVLTVHKSQGSQWDDVVLFDESFAFPDSRARWLYTGVTRAAKKLTLVV